MHLAKQFPAREAPIMRVGDLNNYGYRMTQSQSRKFAINQQLLVDASVKLSLDNSGRSDVEVAGEILKGFRGVKMSLVDRNADAATVELQGLDDVAVGSSKGVGVLVKQPPLRPKQASGRAVTEIGNHILHISKAGDEDLRSPTSNQAGFYKVNLEKKAYKGVPVVPVAPVIPSPCAESDSGSQETARLPTEAAATTMNKARDLASALHYYNGAAGSKKKSLPQTSPQISVPFPSTLHRADTAT